MSQEESLLETNLTFSMALVRMKKGDKVSRRAWADGNQLMYEDGDDGKTILFGHDAVQEWKPTIYDILSDDWCVVEENI